MGPAPRIQWGSNNVACIVDSQVVVEDVGLETARMGGVFRGGSSVTGTSGPNYDRRFDSRGSDSSE